MVPTPLRIAVCMWYDEGCKEYAEHTRQINERFCARHGYTLLVSGERRLPEWAPHWERMPLLLETLRSNLYDAVCWLDADACFNERAEVDLGYFLERYSTKDVILSEDCPYCAQADTPTAMNSGVIILRNTARAQGFLETVLDMGRRPEWESARLGRTRSGEEDAFKDQKVIDAWWRDDVGGAQSYTDIAPWGASDEPTLQTFPWCEGRRWGRALVLHLPSCPNGVRAAFFAAVVSGHASARPRAMRWGTGPHDGSRCWAICFGPYTGDEKTIYVPAPLDGARLIFPNNPGSAFDAELVRVDGRDPPLLAATVKAIAPWTGDLLAIIAK